MLRRLTTRLPRLIYTSSSSTTTTTRATRPRAVAAFSTQHTGVGGSGGGNRFRHRGSTAAVSRPTSSSSSGTTQMITPRSPAPITGLSRLLDDFASTDIFSDPFFRPFFAGRGLMNPLTTALQQQQQQQLDMGLDIAETEQEYIVKAEVPGVAKEDVKVTFQEGILNITAERKEEHVEEDTKHTRHYSDFSYGRVSRSLRVPDAADKEQIDAQLDNGVLTVKIKKGEHEKETVVPVK